VAAKFVARRMAKRAKSVLRNDMNGPLNPY
jgi:hypothetical protein